MNASSFRLGFIGGALNSAVGYAHYSAAQMDQKWELQAGVFSRHVATNQEAGERYGVSDSRCYKTLSDLLDHETGNLDAISILTPTDNHAETVIECLNRGLPVICEKPLATTSDEAKEIQRVCSMQNGFLAMVYNYSGYPMVRELRRMIREGELGDLVYVNVEMPQEGFIRTDPNGNKMVPQRWRARDGSIPTLYLDLGDHLHHLVRYLTGLKPLEVVSDQSNQGWFDVIDNVSCLCRFTKQVKGQIWFSKCALGHRNGLRLRIYGTAASAEWYQLNPEELIISKADGNRQIFDRASNAITASEPRYNRFKAGHPAGFVEAMANLYSDYNTALKQYKETGQFKSDEVFGPPLALEGLLFMEAMVRSCQSGQWEPVGNKELPVKEKQGRCEPTSNRLY